ncbi:hypothetical protein HYS96_02290 [Candidatus Daviesbacteria bacterium]|nr:hypothetical protein [Candidatus Daviesbacteria bacterium]
MKRFFQKTTVWVSIFFLLSSIFRLSNLNLMEFKSDEATTVFQTIQFFDRPYLIARGLISGTGVYNFPLFNYLIIIIAAVSKDPQVLSWMIALINSVLVGIFFLLVKRYYNFLTAILAATLLAFSPWAVIFSRKIWAQDLINLLLIPILWLLHEIILKKTTKVFLPLFALLTLLIQLHGSGLFFAAVTVIVLLILRVRVKFKQALAGILIGLIPILPYVFFQINSYPSCPDCEAFLNYQQSFRIFDFNNFLKPFQIISGLGYHFVLGKSYTDFIAVYPLVNQLKYIFFTGFFVTLMGILFVIAKKQKYLFLVIYFVTLPFLFFITKTPAYMHYFVIIIPVSTLLFAVSLSTAYSFLRNKLLRASIITYFLLFLASNIAFLIFFNNFLAVKKQIDGDYGPVYSVTKSFIEKETSDYKSLPYYQFLKSYAYMYAQSKNFHTKLGEFFLEKGEYDLAAQELKK